MKRNIVIAKHAAKDDISLLDQSLHPFLMITDEPFPRVMVTRRLSDKHAEYFGPFLPETAVRFFLEKISRLFKFRTCLIDIDGSFDVPCPQFYAKRCLAPCVRSLCSPEKYSEMIELLRQFLTRQKDEIRIFISSKIEKAAEDLDFETAAELRDFLNELEEIWKDKHSSFWLDKASDTWEIERRGDRLYVFLVTMRGRKSLGKRVFAYDFHKRLSDEEILEWLFMEFYQIHAPSEIRVPVDFPDRKMLAQTLSQREKRAVKITVIDEGSEKITARRAIARNKFEFDLRNVAPPVEAGDLKRSIKNILKLKRIPSNIESFDTAHISGTNSAGACAVWRNGRFQTDEYRFWLLGELGELESLAESLRMRISIGNLPDLLIIDGGRSHLNAAVRALEICGSVRPPVAAAVKPARKHGEISHFLLENGERVDYVENIAAFNVLKQIRDEAHILANSVHGISRDFSHFYEPAAALPSLNEGQRRELIKNFGSVRELREVEFSRLENAVGKRLATIVVQDLERFEKSEPEPLPFIVPVRYDDPNGDARYLQPLKGQK